jgi:hypothetical protein
MNRAGPFRFCCLLLMAIAGCSPTSRKTAPPGQVQEAAAPAYQVDPLTAGSISGMIRYIGKRPLPKRIDMSGDPACVEAHHENTLDETLVVSSKGGLSTSRICEIRAGAKNLCDALNAGCDGSEWVLVQAAGSWYADEPGPADYELRSGQYSAHGADRPGVEL